MFERVKGNKFAFLNANNIWASFKDSVANNNMFIVVSETLHVPRDNKDTFGGCSIHP